VAQYYPVVLPGGNSIAGASIGFHAYSLRIDNLTNQWLLEETSISWIPPYSLGVCLRLYGTSVAILLNRSPVGQPQLAPVTGEEAVAVYSDQYRTEVAGSPVRQFTLVQAVSDLTQGPMPAFPPVGVTRLWADSGGTLHRVLATGADATVIDSSNYASYVAGSPLGGDLYGTVNVGHVALRNGSALGSYNAGGTLRNFLQPTGDNYNAYFCLDAGLVFVNYTNTTRIASMDNNGNFGTIGWISAGPSLTAAAGDLSANRGGTGVVYLGTTTRYLLYDGSVYNMPGAGLALGGNLTMSGPTIYFSGNSGVYWNWDGTHMTTSQPILGNVSVMSPIYYMGTSGSYYLQLSGATMQHVGMNILSGGWVGFAANAGLLLQYNSAQTSGGSITAGGIQSTCALGATGQIYAMSGWGGNLSNTNAILAPNIGDYRGQGLAWQWATWACVDHAVEYGLRVEPIYDPLCFVRNLRAYSYDHMGLTAEGPMRLDSGEIYAVPTYGFRASEVAEYLPELVGPEGESVDLGRMAAVLWEAVRELDRRIVTLESAR
jgi:hypothetical protein